MGKLELITAHPLVKLMVVLMVEQLAVSKVDSMDIAMVTMWV